MERFGDFLKVHREKKGIRLEEIASITKINLRSLELLEGSQWAELPPEPFIRGFIIAYAKYVGLETKVVLERYFGETGQRPAAETAVAPADPLPQPPSQLASDVINQSRSLPSGAIFAGAGVAVVVGLITVIVYIGKSSVAPTAATTATENVMQPAPPASTLAAKPGDVAAADTRAVASPKEAAPETKTAAVVPAKAVEKALEKKEETAVPGDVAHNVVIESKERTWARVIIDDQPPQKFYLREGEKVTYTAKEKMKVVIGNGEVSKVRHNGKLVYGFKAGETLRAYRFPGNAKFPQDNAARRAAAARSEEEKAEGGNTSPALPEKADAPYIPPTE